MIKIQHGTKKNSDISKKTVAIILFCAILLSILSTFMIINKEPIVHVQRYSTIGTKGQIGLTILDAPKTKGAITIEILKPK